MATVILAPTLGETVRDAVPASHPIYGSRPVLRGRIHQAAALVSIPTGVQLIDGARGTGAMTAVIAYAVTCTLMFTTSAAYHRLAQGVVARFWMRRFDHSMILVHIAGSTTPIALLGVGGAMGLAMVAASWGAALVGASLKMTGLTADHDPGPWFFPVLGLLPLLAVPSLAAALGWQSAALLVAAATTYAAGAFCFSRKYLDAVPTIFGYHEVWHVFTVVAGVFQFILTVRLATL